MCTYISSSCAVKMVVIMYLIPGYTPCAHIVFQMHLIIMYILVPLSFYFSVDFINKNNPLNIHH